MAVMQSIKSALLTGLVFTGIGTVAYSFTDAALKSHDEMIKRYKANEAELDSLKSSLNEAVKISAGDDRIWTTPEKRNFLDNLGITEIIGEGQDVYFRDFGNLGFRDFGVNVVLGYNLENNGRFLKGSSANSGTVIGEVNRLRLEKYVSENR